MDVTLTYAVPVYILDLGANLSACNETRPIVDTLRLCNCFGQGDKAFITKLPIELLTAVGSCMVQPLRVQAADKWERDFRCFEERCHFAEHLSRKERIEIYKALVTAGRGWWSDEPDGEEHSFRIPSMRYLNDTVGEGMCNDDMARVPRHPLGA